MASVTYPVDLYIYDLTRGMASQLAPMLMGSGLNLDGVWHTAIVVHNYEWFYGSGGITNVTPPGTTELGQPLKTQRLGTTSLDFSAFNDYLAGLGRTQFVGNKYDLFHHNCNNFSDVVAKFLCPSSSGVPRYIIELPERVLQTPFGAMLKPMIEQMTPQGGNQMQSGNETQSTCTNSGDQTSRVGGKHIPMHDIVGFRSNVDPEKLLKKLAEFNDVKESDTKYCISNQQFEILENLLKCPEKVDSNSSLFGDIWEKCIKPVILTWTKDKTFPVLDILRWYLGRKESNKVDETIANDILNVMLSPNNELLSNNTPETALRLTLRILSNCFFHTFLHKSLLEHRENIIGTLNNIVETSKSISEGSGQTPSNLEVAVSTIALNYTIVFRGQGKEELEEASFQLISALCTTYIERFHGLEALYRALVAIGNILYLDAEQNGSVKDLAEAIDIKSALSKCRTSKSGFEKLKEATCECDKFFS